MTDAGATTPRRVLDEDGRLIPMTVEEVRARAEEVKRRLDALDEIGDPGEQRRTHDLLMAAPREGRIEILI